MPVRLRATPPVSAAAARSRRVGRVGVEAPRPVHQPGDGVAAQRQGEAAGAHRRRCACPGGGRRATAASPAVSRVGVPDPSSLCRRLLGRAAGTRRTVAHRSRPPVRSVTSGPLDRAGPGAEGENGRPHDATGPPTGPTRQEAGRDEHQRGSTPVHRGRHRSGPPAPLLGARRGLVVLRSARRDADPRRPRPPVVGRPGRRPGLPARGRTPGRDRPRSRSARCPTTPPRSAHLVVPEHVERAGALGAVLTAEQAHAPVTGVARPVPEPARYEAMVAEALARMEAGAAGEGRAGPDARGHRRPARRHRPDAARARPPRPAPATCSPSTCPPRGRAPRGRCSARAPSCCSPATDTA